MERAALLAHHPATHPQRIANTNILRKSKNNLTAGNPVGAGALPQTVQQPRKRLQAQTAQLQGRHIRAEPRRAVTDEIFVPWPELYR